jgi:hypothetical protein
MTSDRLLKDALIPVHRRRGIGFNMSESVQVLVKRLESSAAPFPCGLTQTLLISTPRFRRNALYSLPICRRSEKLRITPLGGLAVRLASNNRFERARGSVRSTFLIPRWSKRVLQIKPYSRINFIAKQREYLCQNNYHASRRGKPGSSSLCCISF